MVASGPPGSPPARGRSGFNPLHCGAVVASWRLTGAGARKGSRFNPLHCGAVVASSEGHPYAYDLISFNPLHCGAVVASARAKAEERARHEVSIPFIAGQWSLHAAAGVWLWRSYAFQSPSLRGSGRFGWRPIAARTSIRVSIPFIAGQWSLLPRMGVPGLRRPQQVSIPFIAGQWSLHANRVRANETRSGFNPLHCGAVVASLTFITWNWATPPRFNPLHCGAVVASFAH